MTEPKEKKIIFSIETAVEGGSLSVLENSIEIAGWSGTLKISRAEEVLDRIGVLLKQNNITKNQIKLIGIARNVGSLTGQKIGLALAKGLTKSLKCGLVETSVLEALLLEIKDDFEGECITAVASGKNHIWWQVFIRKDNFFDNCICPQVSGKDEFYKSIKQINFEKIVFRSELSSDNNSASLPPFDKFRQQLIMSEQSLAKLTGLRIAQNASDNAEGYAESYINNNS